MVITFASGGLTDRGVSSWFSKIGKKFADLVGDSDAFKSVWRMGRSFLDAAAAATGIPMSELRSRFAKKGIPEESLELAARSIFGDDPNAIDDLTDEELNERQAAVEANAKTGTSRPDLIMLVVGIGAAAMLLNGGGRGRGRRRRGRGFRRSSFRSFSRSRRRGRGRF